MSYDIERDVIYERDFDPEVDAPELIGLIPRVSTRVWGTSIGSFEISESHDGVTTHVTISKELFELMKAYRYVEA